MVSFLEKNVFSHPFLSRLGDAVLVLCVLLAGTALPRLVLSGDSPKVDEGQYAFAAQWIHHSLVNGRGLPDTGSLSLYPMLFSWVFYFDYNPIVALRLLDLCVALLASFLLYEILKKESGNRVVAVLITLIFTYTMNQYAFIEGGFKNSIMAAFVPLFLAIRIGQQIVQADRSEVSNSWWIVGALTALSVILREPFVSFAVLGLITVFVARGWKAALRFILGGSVTGTLVIGGILLARGGITETLSAYRDAGIVFSAVPEGQITANFIRYGLNSIKESSVALILSVLASLVLIPILVIRRSRRTASGFLFWLSFIGVALIEPATKIGYIYHFAMTLPGFAGICALALREVVREWPNFSWANKERRDAIALLGVMLSVLWFSLEFSPWVRSCWPVTLETLDIAPDGAWSEIFEESPFLIAAKKIKEVMPENGTLSVNRNYHVFHLLTGHLPPSNQLASLSSLVFRSDFSVSRIKEALMKCAPDVMLIQPQDDWQTGNSNSQLLAAIKEAGIYEIVSDIPIVTTFNEHITWRIYRKTKETACLV
ncbi:hypothetical protein FACS1894158_17520 [Betaproteobacteria bacterium]|nr:hypothetical protein FACS1894158_17520 [Betaproteobacteria bacterium]